MFKIEIKKNNVLTNMAEFSTMDEVNLWLNFHKESNTFGKSQREATEKLLINADGEEIPYLENEDISKSISIREESDNETGDIVRIHMLPAEYDLEITDVTQENIAKKESQEALKYLADTDWYVVRKMETNIEIPKEVFQNRAEARLKVI